MNNAIIPYLKFADLVRYAEQQAELTRHVLVMCKMWRTMWRVIECAKEIRDWNMQDHILTPKEQAFALALKDFELLLAEVEAGKK